MSDPFVTDDPEEGDLTLDSAPRPERSRTFTPGRDQRAAPNIPFRRVVSRESGPEEDLEALEAAPAEASGPMTWDTADGANNLARSGGQLLPALQRNKTYDFLDSVHYQTDPDAMESRIGKWLRISAVVLLCGTVITLLGSIFVFRASRPPAGGQAVTPARPAVVEEVIDPQAEAARAVATLRAFLASTVPAERQKLIGPNEPLPPDLATPGRVAALEKSTFNSDDARTVRLGRQVAVLVPITDHRSGVPRTAALLNQAGEFRVDWRSLVTPESMPWEEFVATPVDEPRLFRVELAAPAKPDSTAGTVSVRRPAGQPTAVTVTVDPQSRLAGDLRAAFEKRNGKSLAADVYLQGSPGGPLRMVGWTLDKWAM